VCLFGSGVASATTYTITDLGSGSSNGGTLAVDTYNGKQIVVGGGWYWTQGNSAVTNLLPLLPSGWDATSCAATGVNSSGQIVGSYITATNTVGSPFVYSLSTATASQLTIGSGDTFQGMATINENGVAVGYYESGGDNPEDYCFVSNVNTNTPTLVGGQTPVNGIVTYAINNNGFVAGRALNAYTTADQNAWNGSTWVDLGQGANGKGGYAYGIDSNGDVVGLTGVSTATKGDPSYDHYNGTGWNGIVDLGNLNSVAGYSGYNAGQAMGINDSAQVVGWVYNGSKVLTSEYAFIAGTTASSVVPLSNYVPSLGDFTRLSQALAIDDAGCIAGTGITNTSSTDTFLLTPTPEPSTLLLAISGLLGLLACAWRKRTERGKETT
jgi:hypothetical protein